MFHKENDNSEKKGRKRRSLIVFIHNIEQRRIVFIRHVQAIKQSPAMNNCSDRLQFGWDTQMWMKWNKEDKSLWH